MYLYMYVCMSFYYFVFPDETNKINGTKPVIYNLRRIKANDPKHLSGDYSQLQVARHTRNMHVKDRQSKIFVAADVSIDNNGIIIK